MHAAAAELQFELAARLRDEIGELKKELRGHAGGDVAGSGEQGAGWGGGRQGLRACSAAGWRRD